MMHVQTEFFAEVCTTAGPTGEMVFVKAATLVDYGDNFVGGPYSTASEAAARQKRWPHPTKLRACKGMAYRGVGILPAGGEYCGLVEESEVRTLPVNVTDGAKAVLDAMKAT